MKKLIKIYEELIFLREIACKMRSILTRAKEIYSGLTALCGILPIGPKAASIWPRINCRLSAASASVWGARVKATNAAISVVVGTRLPGVTTVSGLITAAPTTSAGVGGPPSRFAIYRPYYAKALNLVNR